MFHFLTFLISLADNRLIEEQYQREMMEKEELGGHREKPHKPRTNLNQQGRFLWKQCS